MGKQRRNWTAAQKLEIIKDVESMGLAEALRHHNVSSSVYYRWKDKYDVEGAEGLKRGQGPVDKERLELHREIERLRQVIADQAVTIRIKDELLKKTKYR